MLLLGAATAALLCGGPAFAADTANTTVAITGTSPNTCTLAPAAATVPVGGVTSTATTVNVTPLFDTTDSHVITGGITLNWTGMCNYVHNITLKSDNGALINASAATNAPVAGSGAFTQRLGYTANFVWAGTSATTAIPDITSTSDATSAGPVNTSATTISGANAGNLAVTLGFAAHTAPTVAGAYADNLTVQIGAAL
jgi:hypothetical protein